LRDREENPERGRARPDHLEAQHPAKPFDAFVSTEERLNPDPEERRRDHPRGERIDLMPAEESEERARGDKERDRKREIRHEVNDEPGSQRRRNGVVGGVHGKRL
jgi:hypothetical protein